MLFSKFFSHILIWQEHKLQNTKRQEQNATLLDVFPPRENIFQTKEYVIYNYKLEKTIASDSWLQHKNIFVCKSIFLNPLLFSIPCEPNKSVISANV